MKVWNYFYIGLTWLILFNIFGLLGGGGFLEQIGFTRVGEDISFNFSNISETFLKVFAAAITTGIAIGYFTKSKTENYVLIAIILTVLFGLIASFVSIWTAAAGYPSFIKAVLAVILVPFIAGYILALAEWFRGTD